ncbi:MAG: hypothetical protein ACRD1Y_15135 [Terriglobales bacterium]
MSGLKHRFASFLWWSYPRGSLEYDIMVGVILAFIFLVPRAWFHDQPRRPARTAIVVQHVFPQLPPRREP